MSALAPIAARPGMAEFLRAVQSGAMTMREAADSACISRATVAGWLRKADMGQEPYAGFLRSYRAALEWKRKGYLANIEVAAEDDWRAAAYLTDRIDRRLERLPDPVQEAWAEKTPDEVLDMMCQDPEVAERLRARLLAGGQ